MTSSATFPDLADVSVFITGGGSGIGAALTEGFVAQGARVAFVQRSDAGELVASLASRYGRAPLFIECDVTDIAALRSAIEQAGKVHGTIKVLVNNAANDMRHRLADYDVADWDASMAVNLRPHFFTAQAVAPGMRASGGGSIINYSSIAYMMGNADYASYVAAKAAITGLTRGLARELGKDRIRVNALMPGWVLTPRQKRLWASPDKLATHLARQCLPEHLTEADMVEPTLFLASNASRMMTGQALVVDGGVAVSG